MRILKWLLVVIVVLIVGMGAWLAVAPPDLIRVGTNYAAKIVCSNVFLAGRDADVVLADDVQAPGHPILRFVSVDVDRQARQVEATLLGFVAPATVVARPGFGCTALQDRGADIQTALEDPNAGDRPASDLPTRIDPAVQAVVEDDTLTGPGVRAVVVLRNGVVVAEHYAEGFDAETPLLGWSMAKTITAALIGRMEQDGLINRNDENLFAEWEGDARTKIKVSDLLGMASDLDWNEGYGNVSDVTRMLFLTGDIGAFASNVELQTPDGSNIGKAFNYSSGTSVVLSRYWQNALGADAEAYPDDALFDPLGMDSAIMEMDETGTFVGGSFTYATARDWARFGQFLLQKGVWRGEQLLPFGYVHWMMERHPASNGVYARGHIWRKPPGLRDGEPAPAELNETVWLGGHDGQSVAIMDDARLVVVRLGLTPSKLGYSPAPLAVAVRKAARR